MRVAVTGGTGFIGRHLIAHLCARGDQVRYLTRRQSTQTIDGATPFAGSLASPLDELRKFARDVDILYHCAAEVRDESAMRTTNVTGTANLLEAAGDDLGRWVQLSSTGVYGQHLPGNTNEGSAVNPANPYEASKAAADEILRVAAVQRNFPSVILRPSVVYGNDMPNQSVFQLIGAINSGLFFFIGQPGAVSNYVHVDNVVDALMRCAHAPLPANGRAYIVSDHRTLEVIVAIVAAALGKSRSPMRFPAPMVRAISRVAGIVPSFPLSPSRIEALTSRTVYVSDRIRTELGHENRISMEAGIGELARYWKAQGHA